MIYTVSEDVEIFLDGKKYLLESGDRIVLEDLSSKEVEQLKEKFGPVNSVEDYWKTVDALKTYLKKTIGKARRTAKENEKLSPIIDRKIKDVKDFMDNIDDFVVSLADNKTAELINQDKIKRIQDIDQTSDFLKSSEDYKSEKESEHIKAFGETPKQAVERMRREREERKDKLFESIRYLSSL